MSSESGPNLVTNGLVLCLDAANPLSYKSGATIWNDLTYNTSGGTLTNGPTFSSTNGGSIVFDGIDDYAQIPPIPQFSSWSEITIVSIVKPLVVGENKQRLVDTANGPGTNGGNSFGIKFGTNSPFSDISFFIVSGSTNSDAVYQNVVRTATGVIQANNIYNVTARWRKSDGSADVFVNGVKPSYAATLTFTGTPNPLTNPVFIGLLKFHSGVNLYGNQQIYQTLIYNRYLTDSEVLQNYNSTKSRFGL